MSWLFSQALAAEYSAVTCSDGAPSAPSNGTPTPRAYLSPDKMTDFSRLSRFGMTFGPLTEDRGAELLTWFLAGFPVPTYPPQEKEPESPESTADSGWKWRESSVKYDPVMRLWKTRQCSLLADSEWFSETWPKWGSMHDGECWELPMSARPIFARGSGLWQTPVADDSVDRIAGKINSRGEPKLSAQVKLWPTPGAAKANNDLTLTCSGDGRKKPNKLGWAVAAQMWPTPTVTSQAQVAWDRTPGQTGGTTLKGAVYAAQGVAGGSLNPTWVEWLMGWPLGWTALEPLAMDKFHSAPQPYGGC